jgi:hypothetical protein
MDGRKPFMMVTTTTIGRLPAVMGLDAWSPSTLAVLVPH